ncbi:MAG: response regulator [Flavobacteriales bacterium]|nr:response regulator [Flavobacteriales bacterium]MCB9192675.1 response regulator [Flavobacteriales bacterium]MCB9203551.1 response regulator [Flavobacteriales bacterium]
MEKLKLLLVEDESLNDYQRRIKAYNLESSVQVEPVPCADYNQAVRMLDDSNNSFDGAIIDLKLSKDAKYEGKELINRVKKGLRFPVFVLTGNPEQIEDQKAFQTDFFQIRTKGDTPGRLEEILGDLVKLHQTGITKILGGKGQIEGYLNDIFWNHISNSIGYWVADSKRDSQEKQQSLLRYALSHVQEYLNLDGTGLSQNYHPAEFFITKPVKRYVYTGDLIKFEAGERSLVLSPACDLEIHGASCNADNILLLKVRDWKDLDARFSGLNKDTGKANENRARLERWFANPNQRYHYIPNSNGIEAGFIDFQDKKTMSLTVFNQEMKDGKLQRLATVSSPFLKDIIARHSSYYARQGSPDFDGGELYDILFK